MCQALPAYVVRIDGDLAWVREPDAASDERLTAISLLGVSDVHEGDYVLHHAGLALTRVEPEEARAILDVWRELGDLLATEAGAATALEGVAP